MHLFLLQFSQCEGLPQVLAVRLYHTVIACLRVAQAKLLSTCRGKLLRLFWSLKCLVVKAILTYMLTPTWSNLCKTIHKHHPSRFSVIQFSHVKSKVLNSQATKLLSGCWRCLVSYLKGIFNSEKAWRKHIQEPKRSPAAFSSSALNHL